MQVQGKATALWSNIFKLSMPQIRAFHMTWFAFFLCFFAWFGIAPLISVVRDELRLTQEQIGWNIIASVAMTVVARVFIGWLCDRIGPRLAFTGLLIAGSIPVMLIGLAHDPWTFIVFRLLIGVIGGAFVIAQYHTSVMFAPNVVGTANATSAGWGNLGGGVTQFAMPLLFSLFVSTFAVSSAVGWRLSMVSAGLLCLLTGIAYFFLTQDFPQGNIHSLRSSGKLAVGKQRSRGAFREVCRDHRVWALFVIYGACFGVELTMNNIAALYFLDYYDYFKELDTVHALKAAGMIAALFGLMNICARTLGGIFGDAFGLRWGLKGRVTWLFMTLLGEGLALMLFSQLNVLVIAIPALTLFSLLVQMSEGATYSIVPFVNKRALGAVSGIVGAGGNAGAVAAGFLLKGVVDWPLALLVLGTIVTLCSFATFAVTFSPEAEEEARRDYAAALAQRRGASEQPNWQPAQVGS